MHNTGSYDLFGRSWLPHFLDSKLSSFFFFCYDSCFSFFFGLN